MNAIRCPRSDFSAMMFDMLCVAPHEVAVTMVGSVSECHSLPLAAIFRQVIDMQSVTSHAVAWTMVVKFELPCLVRDSMVV